MSLLAIILPTLAVLVSIVLNRLYAARLEARIAEQSAASRSTMTTLQSKMEDEMATLRWNATGDTNSVRADLGEVQANIALLRNDLHKLAQTPKAQRKPASHTAKRKPPRPETSLSRPVPSLSPSSHPADPAA
jgi:hypothetical protein